MEIIQSRSNFRNFCKIYKAKVLHKQEHFIIVDTGVETRNVLYEMVPEVKVGDTVTIHQGFAVEIVE